MPTTITATLILDDSDPPRARLNVQLDGETIANRDLTPSEAVSALSVIAPESDEVWAPARAIVTGLLGAVDQGATAQATRELALKDWQVALKLAPSQEVARKPR